MTSCLVTCLGGSIAVGAAIVGAFQFIHLDLSYWPTLQRCAPYFAAWILAQTMCQVAGEACRGCDRFALAAAVYTKSGGWIVNVLSAILVLALWPRAEPADLTHVMLTQVVATAVPAVLGFVALYGGLTSSAVPPTSVPAASAPRPEPTVAWLIRESWPIFVSYAVIIGIEQLDILVVRVLCDDAAVADYGVAKRWLALVNFAFVTLAPAITPFIAELHERRDPAKLERLMRGAATMVAIPTILICILLLAGAGLAIEYTFGPQRLGAVAPLRILLAGQVLLSLAGHSYVALSMTGHQRSLMRCSLWVGGFYLLFGPAAISLWGIVGAGAAKSVATAARAVAAAILVRTKLGFWSTASLSPAALRDVVALIVVRVGRLVRGEQPKPAANLGAASGDPPE